LRFDLHNKTIYGGVLDLDNNFIYSGNDYSSCLDYSIMSEKIKAVFFESNNLPESTNLYVRNAANVAGSPSESEPAGKYRIFFQFTNSGGHNGPVVSYWNIAKVEYENLF
jgi:hypothetical protein